MRLKGIARDTTPASQALSLIHIFKFQSWSKDTIFSEKVYEDNYFLKDDYRNRTDYTLKEIGYEYSINREDHYLLNEYCK